MLASYQSAVAQSLQSSEAVSCRHAYVMLTPGAPLLISEHMQVVVVWLYVVLGIELKVFRAMKLRYVFSFCCQQAQGQQSVLEGKLTWLVYMIGAMVGGYSWSDASASDGEETIDASLARRVFRLAQGLDARLARCGCMLLFFFSFIICRAFRGSDPFSRVGRCQGDPARPVIFKNLMTRPDSTREISNIS